MITELKNADIYGTSTEHFNFWLVQTNRIEHPKKALLVNDKPASISDDGICQLFYAETSAFKISEVKKIPIIFRIISEKDSELDPSNYPVTKTIVGYQDSETIVEITIVGPYYEQSFDEEYPYEKYRSLMREVVVSDPRFEIDTRDEDLTKGAIEAMKDHGITLECDHDAVTFTVNLNCLTVGELASALDNITFELEEKVKQKYHSSLNSNQENPSEIRAV